MCTGIGGFGDASSASLYTFTQKKLQKTAPAEGILLKLFMEAVGQLRMPRSTNIVGSLNLFKRGGERVEPIIKKD